MLYTRTEDNIELGIYDSLNSAVHSLQSILFSPVHSPNLQVESTKFNQHSIAQSIIFNAENTVFKSIVLYGLEHLSSQSSTINILLSKVPIMVQSPQSIDILH